MGIGSLCFFAAVKYMPLADAMAVFFVEPLMLTLLSALILKEQVGWRRRIAVAIGFVGTLIVIQPSWELFGWVSLLPLGTAMLFAIYLILNRRYGDCRYATCHAAICGHWRYDNGGGRTVPWRSCST